MKLNEVFYLEEYQKSKDFVKSPFRYAGGKFYALKLILPYIDCVDYDEYREPFVGGGSVFFAKKKSSISWINDLETKIIQVYQALTDDEMVQQLSALFANEVANKERHSEVKEMTPKTPLEEVFQTYYLNRTSYCGIINAPAWGYCTGKSAPPPNWSSFLKSASKKMKDVRITSLDFSDVITAPRSGKRVLMYLDPPYYGADQKRAYTKSFELEDHIRLCELLKQTEHYFCLSYDNVKEVKDLYKWANVYEKSWLYNTANKQGEHRSLGQELIITNYEAIPSISPLF